MHQGGPKTSLCVSPAVYSTTPPDFPPGPGAPGGAWTIGGRSFTIYKWDGASEHLTRVADTGSLLETKQAMVAGGLCDGCTAADAKNANGDSCEDFCPFNSDESPPKLDDRSDAKGPEPECVTTGVMPDGTRLMFGGLERTGGIVVMDISTPTAPVFQDYLNVRNWMASEEDKAAYKAACDADDESAGCKDFMVAKALNDGPESLVFVPLADVPAGVTLVDNHVVRKQAAALLERRPDLKPTGAWHARDAVDE